MLHYVESGFVCLVIQSQHCYAAGVSVDFVNVFYIVLSPQS